MYIFKKRPRPALRVLAGTALAAAILLTSAVPMTASGESTLSSLKQQYASLQQQQQQLQSQISSKNAKLQTVNQQMAALDKSIALTNQQISVLNAQIADTDARLKAKAADIAATQKRVEENYALYKQRMRAMYEAGNVSYVEVLLSSTNLNDFLSRSEMLKAISVHDNDLINSLKSDVKRLKDDQAALQADKKNLETTQGTLAGQQEALNAQRAQQTQLASDLKAGIISGQQQMSTVKQQASQTDAQINAEVAAEAAARVKQLAVQRAAAQTPRVSSSGSRGNSGGNPGVSDGIVFSGSISSAQLVAYALNFASTAAKTASYPNGGHGYNSVHPYSLGSYGPGAYDCSGFTQRVYAYAGIALSHSAADQSEGHTYSNGSTVVMGHRVNSRSALQPGDLMFFSTEGGGVSHVGIYIGGDSFVAANSSTGIAIVGPKDGSYGYFRSAYLFGWHLIN